MTYSNKPLLVGVVQRITGGCPATPTYSTFTRLSYNDGTATAAAVNYVKWILTTTFGVTTTAQASSASLTATPVMAAPSWMVYTTCVYISTTHPT